jgi:hypothetical protein
MSERSIIAFEGYREGIQKFDYFVSGLTGAIFAYVAQTYSPKQLGFGASSIEPLALVLLAISFFIGLKRIESSNVMMRVNHEMLDASEKAGQAATALDSGMALARDALSGKIVSRDQLEFNRRYQMDRSEKAAEALQAVRAKGDRHYRHRDLFLILGFIAILLAKILQPYA